MNMIYSMSSRKQYQEKFVKAEKIKEIETESKEIFYLFEDLYNDIKQQDKELETIEETINKSVEKIKQTNIEITEIEEITESGYVKQFTGMILGGSIGSLVFLYNPYVAIGTVIGGVIVGGILPKLF